MKVIRFFVCLSLICSAAFPAMAAESEVIPRTRTEVVVREHPKTGEAYVSIIGLDEPARDDLLSREDIPYPRPDYRMLQNDARADQFDYQGPYSSKKKIYIFAASMATLGTVGAVTAAAAFPAAAGAGAAGSGFAAGAGAVAVSSGAAATAVIATRQGTPDEYQRIGESRILETDTDFHKLHIQDQRIRTLKQMPAESQA